MYKVAYVQGILIGELTKHFVSLKWDFQFYFLIQSLVISTNVYFK